MRRGDIYLVDLEPVVGSEASKSRPAIIVSNNAAIDSAEKRGRGVLTVVPLTSNVSRIYPFQVLLLSGESGLRVDSKAQAEQVRSVATERFIEQIGRADPSRMQELDAALRLHLSL